MHLFTGTAGVSPAERAAAHSDLVNPYIVSPGASSLRARGGPDARDPSMIHP